MSILLIQPPNRDGQSLLSGLDAEYGRAERAPTLAGALILARQRRFEAFVLDLRRTRLDGAAAVRDLRRNDELAGMVVIGAHLSLEERLQLLEAGADECLAEPLSEKELEVRLRVLLRRTARLKPRLTLGDLELDLVHRQATRQGKSIPLTAREFAVLECLLRHAGQPLSRTCIFEDVWNRAASASTTNIVDVYINYLRTKVDRGFEPKLIRTVYGLGYLLAVEQQRTA